MEDLVKIEEKHKIKFLDTVRAGATVAVFLFHMGYLFITGYPDTIIQWQRMVYFGGTVGVSVFFVLSGFLLFYQLYKNEEPLTKERLQEYIQKRLLRILPLYYLSLLCIALVLKYDIFWSTEGFKSIVYNLLFLREIKSGGSQGIIPINPVYWSLVVEMHFYILLPIFYSIFYKYKKAILFLLPILLGLLYRVILVFVVKDPSMQFLRFTPANFDFFALGMFGAYIYVKRKDLVQKLGDYKLQILFVILFLACVRFYDFEFSPTFAYIAAPIILGILTVVSILSFLGNDRTLLSRALTVTPVMFIAKISFSIYVWHPVVFEYVEKMSIVQSNSSKIILNTIITLIISTITYYAIEAPFLRLKRKKAEYVQELP